jgi:hypothetical protein
MYIVYIMQYVNAYLYTTCAYMYTHSLYTHINIHSLYTYIQYMTYILQVLLMMAAADANRQHQPQFIATLVCCPPCPS